MEEIQKLKKDLERLEKLNAFKSDQISISAHELRTSLSAIKWMLKMFLDKDFGPITQEQEGFMHKAYDSTNRMLDLVNELLSANHQEEGALTYSFTPTDIVSLIDGIIFDFHGESFKKGIELLFLKPDDAIPFISCDSGKIRVVMQNLIENAIKYSDKGDRIIVSVLLEDEKIKVSVKDTGIGIPEEEQTKIFGKFFRSTNAMAKEGIGSGLGLFTAKNIIARHSGEIWFESSKDTGTTFFFTIPLSHKQLA
jgi:signal transduction histidine kinase